MLSLVLSVILIFFLAAVPQQEIKNDEFDERRTPLVLTLHDLVNELHKMNEIYEYDSKRNHGDR